MSPAAPGVYRAAPSAARAISAVRTDVAGFVGVAPRGPARVPVVDEDWPAERPRLDPARLRLRTVPVAVESFAEYRRVFGGFEGPGRLPYAVAAFFEQGGRRAYVARIVHDYDGDLVPNLNPARPAAGLVRWGSGGESVRLVARSEGRWGGALRAAFGVSRRPLAFDTATSAGLILPADADLPDGSVLLLRPAGGGRELRTATVTAEPHPTAPREQLRVTFDVPASAPPVSVEVVECEFRVDDGERAEYHPRLGLTPGHPRGAFRVLDAESELVYPDPAWKSLTFDPAALDPDRPARLDAVKPTDSPQFAGGHDGYAAITPDDFFDADWVLGNDGPAAGVHALLRAPDVALVCVPDLYVPEPLSPRADVADVPSLAGAAFARCVPVPLPPPRSEAPDDLDGLRLDPRGDLGRITALQQRLEELAETVRTFTVLLDVPPGLTPRQVERWRGAFGSAFAAAYHPWLSAARPDDARDGLVRIPPSAVAAGVIAATEWRVGLAHGPANALAAGVVDVTDALPPAVHDALHPLGVNVFLRERDGVRLTAARTLSRDPQYRQLSVRRLMTQLRLTLAREAQWVVFEPNTAALRAELRRAVAAYLRRLYRAGAFRGATEAEAFFVRTDDTRQALDAGRLVCEVGVAPAEPIEFLLLRLVVGDDGLTITEG